MPVKTALFGILIALVLVLGCSDSSDSGNDFDPRPVPTDFSSVDASMEAFIEAQPGFSGGSYIIVDKVQGVIYQRAFGDYTLDEVVLLASVSKVPSATLLVAMAEDENIDFDLDVTIENYLPYEGVWPGRTAEQMISNTSGMPGFGNFLEYRQHLCQYFPGATLQECGQLIYQTPLDHLPSYPPGVVFEYGGSPWHLAALMAEVAGGATWAQLFDQYVATPCDLEIFAYGNPLSNFPSWNGDPDSLVGRDNPNIEAGAMTNISDYAKLLSLHLNEGYCDENRVLSAAGTATMRKDRMPEGEGREDGTGYGLGWWIAPAELEEAAPTKFIDSGAFGAVAWIDLDRQFGAFIAVQSKNLDDGNIGSAYGQGEFTTLVEAVFDGVR